MPPQEPKYVSIKPEQESPDHRHPLYLGDWKRSVPYVNKGMAVDNMDEPHFKRKFAILKEHPEIRHLEGPDPWTKYIIFASTFVQLSLSYFVGQVWKPSIIPMILIAYCIGGTITALYGVIIHELSHNLCSPSPFVNRLLALVVNTCIPFPIAASFRRYHLNHHAYMGVENLDPDLPMSWELKLIKGNTFMKMLWIFIYPVMYVVRGTVNFKPLSFWEIINVIYTVIVDALVIKFCGVQGFLYLFLSLWLGYGLHPGAAHFIQEHFTFDDGQETYSYYGSLNKFYLNIGYHNEHHDFMHVSLIYHIE
jgi:sphingolipid delta-4 desaturase